jgi:hypothetical protein
LYTSCLDGHIYFLKLDKQNVRSEKLILLRLPFRTELTYI